VTGFSFLYIENSPIGAPGAFFIYAAGCILAFIYCWYELPETRGKNFTQVMARFGIKVEQKQVSEDPKTLKEIQFQQLPSTQTKST